MDLFFTSPDAYNTSLLTSDLKSRYYVETSSKLLRHGETIVGRMEGTQSLEVLEVATINLSTFGKDSVQLQGRDATPRFVGTWRNSKSFRSFTASDDLSYHWKYFYGDFTLYSADSIRVAFLNSNSHATKGAAMNLQPMLSITSAGLHIVDDIVVTLIYTLQRRVKDKRVREKPVASSVRGSGSGWYYGGAGWYGDGGGGGGYGGGDGGCGGGGGGAGDGGGGDGGGGC